jgi:uncharacterized membrane protein
MTLYVVAGLAALGLAFGFWLYRRGRDVERGAATKENLDAEKTADGARRDAVHLDDAERERLLNRRD